MGLVGQLSNLSLEEDEIQTHEILLVQNKEKELDEKLMELQQWKSRNVYREVSDQGQECMSLIWVI